MLFILLAVLLVLVIYYYFRYYCQFQSVKVYVDQPQLVYSQLPPTDKCSSC